jgi:hypothetical protein
MLARLAIDLRLSRGAAMVRRMAEAVIHGLASRRLQRRAFYIPPLHLDEINVKTRSFCDASIRSGNSQAAVRAVLGRVCNR